jgi:hypothetical protein
LLIDQDAIPTIVEVKRSSDTRIRREVVGQILEYAANASVYWPAERLRGWFEEHLGGPEAAATKIQSDIGIEDVDAFWAAASSNLQTGHLRLVFVADSIPMELRRIVEFLDEQMSRTQVVAIEVRRYREAGDPTGLAALVPRVVAKSVRGELERSAVSRAKRQWDETSVLQELEDRAGREAVAVATDLLDWAKSRSLRLWYGSGKATGSVYPMLDLPAQEAAWTFGITTDGLLQLPFGWMATRSGFAERDARIELLDRLNQIPSIRIDATKVDLWPSVRLADLAPSDRRALKDTFQWVIDVILGAARGEVRRE